MKYVLPQAEARFARLGKAIFPISDNTPSRQAAEMCIENLEAFFHDIGLKTKLSELNIENDKFHEMAVRSVDQPAFVTAKPGVLGEFVPLNAEDVEKIYHLAYDSSK